MNMPTIQLQKEQFKKISIFFSRVFTSTYRSRLGDNAHQEHCFTCGSVPESFACSKLQVCIPKASMCHGCLATVKRLLQQQTRLPVSTSQILRFQTFCKSFSDITKELQNIIQKMVSPKTSEILSYMPHSVTSQQPEQLISKQRVQKSKQLRHKLLYVAFNVPVIETGC